MKIEHVAFYVRTFKDPKNFTGSLHVYICDYGMDLKGINCKIKKGVAYVDLPYGIGEDDGKKIKFPLISFCDAKKHKDLITQIRRNLMPFLIEEMKSETLSK